MESNGRHPIFGLFGIPVARNLFVAPAAKASPAINRFSLSIDHSNIFAGGRLEDERLLLDGETSRLSVDVSATIARCWAAALDVPFVAHHSGGLDQFIEQWHDAFSLPTSRRELAAQDQLRYEYTTGNTELSLAGAYSGIGDIALQWIYQPNCSNTENFVYRFGLKLPTGKLETMSGSGSTDYFAEANSRTLVFNDRWSGKARVGMSMLGQAGELQDLQPLVFYGTAVLGLNLSEKISLATQIDWHSPVFESDLTELGRWTAQLGVGMRWRFSPGRSVDVGFQEDIVVDTSPDIVFHLNYRHSVR